MFNMITRLCFILGFLTLQAFAAFETTHLKHPHGITIRVGKFKTPYANPHAKTILICPGRSSFIEKNTAAATYLAEQGFNVYVLDWTGHGASDRLISHQQKVFINTFDEYVKDVELALAYIQKQGLTDIYLYGSSMGGNVVLRYLMQQPHTPIKGAILVAPMFGINTSPFPQPLARFIAWFKTKVGSGGSYCYGFGNFDPQRDRFATNKNTHDEAAFNRQREITLGHMHMVTGGPTFGWLHAAFKAVDYVRDCSKLSAIQTPLFIAEAGDERVVDNSQNGDITRCLPRLTHKVYQGAYHNLMCEVPSIREPLLADIAAFIQNPPA
jgi:lysophospholipase